LSELEAIARPAYELPTVAAIMAALQYRELEVMLSESGVRAVTILYVRDRWGLDASLQAIHEEVESGFFWMPELVDRIDSVRGSAEAGGPLSSLGDSELLSAIGSALKAWSADRDDSNVVPPFRGPMRSVSSVSRRVGSPLGVYLDPEQLQGSSPLRTYLEEEYPRGAELRAGTRDAWEESGTAAVYGSPSSNPLLADLLAVFGWKVTADAVFLSEQEIRGENLILIASYPSPTDQSRGVLLYASVEPLHLVGIHEADRPDVDWVVVRRVEEGKYEIVDEGVFEYSDPTNTAGQLW
jgi:hypothetical protein